MGVQKQSVLKSIKNPHQSTQLKVTQIFLKLSFNYYIYITPNFLIIYTFYKVIWKSGSYKKYIFFDIPILIHCTKESAKYHTNCCTSYVQSVCLGFSAVYGQCLKIKLLEKHLPFTLTSLLSPLGDILKHGNTMPWVHSII